MMDDVKMIGGAFSKSTALSVDEARELFVEVTEELIDRFNKDEKIRPYLHNYPFAFDNVDIMLHLSGKGERSPGEGYVALVYKGKGDEIVYRGYDQETQKFYPLHREPYSEAVNLANIDR